MLVDNDVNIMALGERTAHWPEHDNFLFIKVATGIGAGIISSGELQRGANGTAGDLGHVRVPRGDDVLCRCGNYGCLEALASGPAVAAELNASGVPARKGSDVLRLVSDGNLQAIQALRQAGRDVGDVLATVVNLLNPSVIVIGGSLGQAGEHLMAGVREVVYRRSLPLATTHLRIAPVRGRGPGSNLGREPDGDAVRVVPRGHRVHHSRRPASGFSRGYGAVITRTGEPVKPGFDVLKGAPVELPVAFLRDVSEVRGQHRVGGAEEWMGRLDGLNVKHVQCCSPDPALVQCAHQGVLLNQGTAGGVHQEAFGAKEPQLPLTHCPLGTGRQPQMEGGDVGIPEKVLLTDLPGSGVGGSLLGQVLAPRKHFHAECLPERSDPAPDLAQAHHAQGLARQFHPDGRLPCAGPQRVLLGREVPGQASSSAHVSSGAAVGEPGVPQTVMPSSSAAATSMAALAMPVVTRSLRPGSRSSTERGKGVRSRMATTIWKPASAAARASSDWNGSRKTDVETPDCCREDQSAKPCATSW